MAMMVTWWERRDAGDQEAFGKGALNLCRASRARPGVRSARFYWRNLDNVVVVLDSDRMEAFDGPPTPEQMQAIIALNAVARAVDQQRWADAGQGEQVYRSGQR
jgi:hypothetical protein